MIVLDTETMGLDAEKNSLVSIGAVEFENPKNQFYEECRIWDGAEVAQVALDVNGFSQEDITDQKKQSPGQLLASFFEWSKNCRNSLMAGHNVGFDIAFLKAEAERSDLGYPFQHRFIDTYSLAWMHIIQSGKTPPEEDGKSSLNSDFIFEYIGITEEREEHNALEDAKLTAEAISRLAYSKQLLEEYKQFSIPWQ